jgi:hypothetical protein
MRRGELIAELEDHRARIDRAINPQVPPHWRGPRHAEAQAMAFERDCSEENLGRAEASLGKGQASQSKTDRRVDLRQLKREGKASASQRQGQMV